MTTNDGCLGEADLLDIDAQLDGTARSGSGNTEEVEYGESKSWD